MAKTKTVKLKAPVQKQRANVYTMMLIVAFLALSMGTFLMYKELERYDFEYEAPKLAPKRPGAAAIATPSHTQLSLIRSELTHRQDGGC